MLSLKKDFNFLLTWAIIIALVSGIAVSEMSKAFPVSKSNIDKLKELYKVCDESDEFSSWEACMDYHIENNPDVDYACGRDEAGMPVERC
jgi:hypothetical protein